MRLDMRLVLEDLGVERKPRSDLEPYRSAHDLSDGIGEGLPLLSHRPPALLRPRVHVPLPTPRT